MAQFDLIKKEAFEAVVDVLQTNDAQVQSTINTASALAAVDLQRGFVGDNDLDQLPPVGGSADGDLSWYLSNNKVFQLIQLSSGSWVDFGKPLATSPKPFLSESPEWNGTLHVNNPVISGTTENADESYPPAFLDNTAVDGKYYIALKSNFKLFAFSSVDGETWIEEGVLLDKGTGGTFYDSRLQGAVWRYDSASSTYHLYFGATSVANPNDQVIGHATSATVLGTYTVDASPVYDGSDTQDNLGVALNFISLGDVKIIDGEWVFYFAGNNYDGSDFTDGMIFVATGTSWTDINARNICFTVNDLNDLRDDIDVTFVQDPTIIRYNNSYIMCFTAGRVEDIAKERYLHTAVGSKYDFNPTRSVILETGPVDSWYENRVYGADFAVKQDGEYLTPLLFDGEIPMFFAGHGLTGSPNDNDGLTGLITFSSIPNPSILPVLPAKKENRIIEWTPTINWTTDTEARKNFYYKKTGGECTLYIDYQFTSSDVSTADAKISGLPFAHNPNLTILGTSTSVYLPGASIDGGSLQLTAIIAIDEGELVITIRQKKDDGTVDTIDINQIGNLAGTVTMAFQISYLTEN